MLAITNDPRRRPEPYHIVAEMRDAANIEVARMVGRDEAELILVGDLISRIVAQTCRQSGLSIVYTELLDFDGDEIYFASVPALVGRTFGEALLAFEESTLIGLRPAGGAPTLNPPMDTVIGPATDVIVISRGRRHGPLVEPTRRRSTMPAIADRAGRGPRRSGRSSSAGTGGRRPIIRELDGYVARRLAT